MADLDDLERRISDLSRKVDEASRASASAKTTGRIITVLIAITAIIGVWMLVSPFYEAYKNPEPYKRAITAELTENVGPQISSHVQKSLEKVGPEVGRLAVDQFQARYEDLVKVLEAETLGLIENLRAFTETELSETVVNVEIEIQNSLATLVPELMDEDQREIILGNAMVAMEGAVKDIIDAKLSNHITLLSEIETKLLQFPIPTEISQRSNDELAADLNDLLGQYSVIALRRTLAPEQKAFLRSLAEEETMD